MVVRKVGSDSEQSVFTLNVLGMAKRSRLAVDTTLIGHVPAMSIASPLIIEPWIDQTKWKLSSILSQQQDKDL